MSDTAREQRVRCLQLGLIRTLNACEITDETDEELLWRYGQAARPLAVALLTNLTLNGEPVAPSPPPWSDGWTRVRYKDCL